MAMERKLYVEFRLHVNPEVNQETLKELAEQFKDHIWDEWNGTCEYEALDLTNVTYEIVMEVSYSDGDVVKEDN